ncbi:hypothetical protein D3C80_1638790 [compost metagenome]
MYMAELACPLAQAAGAIDLPRLSGQFAETGDTENIAFNLPVAGQQLTGGDDLAQDRS